MRERQHNSPGISEPIGMMSLCRSHIYDMGSSLGTSTALGDVQDSPVPQGFPGGQAGRPPGAFVLKRIPFGAGGEAANYHPAGRVQQCCTNHSFRAHRPAIAQRSPLVRFSQSPGHRALPTRFSASAAPVALPGLNPQGNPCESGRLSGQLSSGVCGRRPRGRRVTLARGAGVDPAKDRTLPSRLPP